MTRIIFHHKRDHLPKSSNGIIPVQLYGIDGKKRSNIAFIGNPLNDPLRRLGLPISPVVFDFLTLALAITAADTFVERKFAADGWTREISIRIPLYKSDIWETQKITLEKTLHYLSGDLWEIEIVSGGVQPPKPYKGRYRLTNLRDLDCACLFSGGLDSGVGAIDLIEQGRSPLLVSHAYTGDRSHQDRIAKKLNGKFNCLQMNANPKNLLGNKNEGSMRTRSFNFLAFGSIGAYAVAKVNQLNDIELYMPENGLISLNAPLTPQRIGSLSTRTTHPYFISSMQEIFDSVGMRLRIINPYQFMTKGEIVGNCLNKRLLHEIVYDTVSCGKWKRKGKQCGKCVPCLIRRAALSKVGFTEDTGYLAQDLSMVLKDESKRDDLLSMMTAVTQLSKRPAGTWISDTGPLPLDMSLRTQYKNVFERGLREVEKYLNRKGLLM